MPRIVHFEIHASDPEVVVKFYEAVFHWKFSSWENGTEKYWLITTGEDNQPGINGGLIKRRGEKAADGQPVNAYVCTLEVHNLDEYLHAVQHHGGTIAVEKVEIPGIGWLAYGKDPDGNLFGMMQPVEVKE